MRKLLNTLYVTTPDTYLALDGENVVGHRQHQVEGGVGLAGEVEHQKDHGQHDFHRAKDGDLLLALVDHLLGDVHVEVVKVIKIHLKGDFEDR
ncbi:hypothetical protein NE646_14595, partial [Bittarella massiliensis]|nr:hypothetical protein [Bittarella massiliensis (ex Durand et al. 2017)]